MMSCCLDMCIFVGCIMGCHGNHVISYYQNEFIFEENPKEDFLGVQCRSDYLL